jgi:hypothetical protein
MAAGAVDLDKLADQSDILFLLLRHRLHGCHPAPKMWNDT